MSRIKKTPVKLDGRPRPGLAAGSHATCPFFVEAPAWSAVGSGWRPLFGSYHELGFSFEWHEFTAKETFDWGRSFHPGSIELCLNLDGGGRISDGRQGIELMPQSVAFYYQGNPALEATRNAGEHHCFITVNYSPVFLKEHFQTQFDSVHPVIRSVLRDEASESMTAPQERMLATLLQLVGSLRHCPVFKPAQGMWFQSKALEVAAHSFFRPEGGELLCTRTQRLARERVEKAKLILKERLQEPPPLEELARMVSCSPFYLSRQFAREGGGTMQQYLRQIRLERAAELLRTGKCNVTEAAMEVGYNSLSHFSATFHEKFGCCPGLYPLHFKTSAEKSH